MFAHQRVASWCAECWSFWSFIWTTNTLSYTLYLWNQTPNHNVEFKAVHNTHHEICSMLDFWGTRINWPIDCGPYNGGSPGEGGVPLPEPEIQNSWLGNVAPQTLDLTRDCLTNRMNQNEQIKGSDFELKLPLQLSAAEMFSIWTSKKSRFPSGKLSMICE